MNFTRNSDTGRVRIRSPVIKGNVTNAVDKSVDNKRLACPTASRDVMVISRSLLLSESQSPDSVAERVYFSNK